MHLSPSKIFLLATNTMFHYDCFKDTGSSHQRLKKPPIKAQNSII